jgi:hypothetical protein
MATTITTMATTITTTTTTTATKTAATTTATTATPMATSASTKTEKQGPHSQHFIFIVTYKQTQQVRVFVTGKPSQHNFM